MFLLNDSFLSKIEKTFGSSISILLQNFLPIIFTSKQMASIDSIGTQSDNFELNIILNQFKVKAKTIIKYLNGLSDQELVLHFQTDNNVLFAVVLNVNKLILNLNDNKLTELPEDLSKLQSLRSLHLSNNKLQKLPESIGNIQTIVRIDVDNNCLTQLPDSITNLKKLKYFDELENNFQSVPGHIIDFFYERCDGTFEDFYSAEQKNKLDKKLHCVQSIGIKISTNVLNNYD